MAIEDRSGQHEQFRSHRLDSGLQRCTLVAGPAATHRKFGGFRRLGASKDRRGEQLLPYFECSAAKRGSLSAVLSYLSET